MKKAFVSMLSITALLVIMVIGTMANVSAQEIQPVTTGSDSSMIAPRYDECELAPEQEDAIMEAVLAENATFADYRFRELENVGCYNSYRIEDKEDPAEQENVTRFYGSIRLMNSENEPRYMSAYFNGDIRNGEINVTYVSEAWPQYDYESYFTEEENMILGYYLKTLLIDYEVYGEHGDMSVWLQVNDMPVYRCLASDFAGPEIARCPTPYDSPDWENFEQEFQQYVATISPEDSLFYSNDWSMMGLVKVRLSGVRSIMNDWTERISFFGEELKFSFSGNATVSADLPQVIGELESQGFGVCGPEDSACDYDNEKMAWYSPEMVGLYAYKSFDDAYIYLNMNGRPGETGYLYVGLSGTNADAHTEDAKTLVNQVAAVLGIDLGEIEFDEERYGTYDKEVSSQEADDITEPSEPEPPERPYRFMTFQKEITIPTIDGSSLPGWERNEGMFYTNYVMDDIGITVGKPYISYWQMSGENYESVQLGENEAYADVMIDSVDYAAASAALNEKIGRLATVTGEWNLDYYPVGYGGQIPLYRYGVMETMAAGAGMRDGDLGGSPVPQAPTFDDAFSKAFSNLQSTVAGEASPTFTIAPGMIGIALAIIAGMASFIFFLLK